MILYQMLWKITEQAFCSAEFEVASAVGAQSPGCTDYVYSFVKVMLICLFTLAMMLIILIHS